MPVLIVYGIPKSVPQPRLSQLCDYLRRITSSVTALKVKPAQVRVFFPLDVCEAGLGEELVCKVEGLFEKPERTSETRKFLASEISAVLRNFCQHDLPQCHFVEVYVPDPKSETGFAYDAKPVMPL